MNDIRKGQIRIWTTFNEQVEIVSVRRNEPADAIIRLVREVPLPIWTKDLRLANSAEERAEISRVAVMGFEVRTIKGRIGWYWAAPLSELA